MQTILSFTLSASLGRLRPLPFANSGAKKGVSSALVKELSAFAGVFKREKFSNKDKRLKFKGSQDVPLQVAFNVDPGNYMWKALVEILLLDVTSDEF